MSQTFETQIRWSNADHRDRQARTPRRRFRHGPLRRHPGARHRQPVRPAPRPRLLPAHGRVRGADVRRGQDPGRLHQARGARVRGGHPGRAPDRPPDPPALPRGLQGRHPARHHGPLDRPGERARRARHDRRVGRADDQRDPVRRSRRRRPRSAASAASSSSTRPTASSRSRSSTSSSPAPATRS